MEPGPVSAPSDDPRPPSRQSKYRREVYVRERNRREEEVNGLREQYAALERDVKELEQKLADAKDERETWLRAEIGYLQRIIDLEAIVGNESNEKSV
ncbi:hypothetical protein HK405_010744 [Cladochytrium tenue]|nr:hypothetical protein HK405_010744 [Cladochytrium tenue]